MSTVLIYGKTRTGGGREKCASNGCRWMVHPLPYAAGHKSFLAIMLGAGRPILTYVRRVSSDEGMSRATA